MDGKRILVIDDDPHLLGLVKLVFSNAGGRVYTAVNGEEGLHRFHLYRPHLVILDVMMPQADRQGIRALLRRLSSVPVILLTSLRKGDDIVRGLDCGIVDCVTKPFSPRVLLDRAQFALDQVSSVSVDL